MSPPAGSSPAPGCYEFGPFRLDPRRRQLQRSGEILALTPKAFDLLQILVTHADRVLEKDELMKRIWPDSFVGDDSLTHWTIPRRTLPGSWRGAFVVRSRDAQSREKPSQN